jgi:hypothetical protein
MQSAENPSVCMFENGLSAQNGSQILVSQCLTTDALGGPFQTWQLG